MALVPGTRGLVVVAMLVLAGCAGQAPPAAVSPPLVAPRPVVPPGEWRPADRWTFDWTMGEESGAKTAEVTGVRDVNGVQYYAVKIGDLQHYYTRDLHWAGAQRDAKVEARSVPPEPWFEWPLEVGRQWRHDAIYEDRRGRAQKSSMFAVVGVETVEVPAGTFTALKVVRETSERDTDQYWYAPEVRWYVRWVGRRGDVEFEERLRDYRPAERLIPAASRR
jgi:hypothetical protein